MPPPERPSTSTLSSSACIFSHLRLHRAAFFIKPMISIRNPRLQSSSIKATSSARWPASVFASAPRLALPVSPPRTATMTAPGNWSSVARTRGCACTPMRRSFSLVSACSTRARRAGRGGKGDHPALAGPVLQLAHQLRRQMRRTAGRQRKFQYALFEAHQPDVALERGLELDIALASGQSHQFGESY